MSTRFEAPAPWGAHGASPESASSPRILAVALGAIGTCAGAAWLWNRRGEAALHAQTSDRLRPIGQGTSPL